MSATQTEARAIAHKLQDVVDGTDGWLNVDKAAGIIATALAAKNAELEAEVARLRRLVMAQSRAIHSPEALSRTGAVKVKALEWEERKTRLGTVWWSAPNPLGGLSIEAASENDKIAAQADYERRVLSALEPAATEGEQEVAGCEWCVDGLQADGETPCPTCTRPAEQAVTDEMVDAAEEAFFKTDDHGEPSYDMRAAIKVAMEAGR